MIKKKNYNIEVLRIVTMMMILILHFLGCGRILTNTTFNSINYFIVYFIEALCIIAVNIFVLISGYFLSGKKEISYKKLLNLMLKVWIYSILIYIVLLITGLASFSIKDLIKCLLPFTTKTYWFINAYIVLYLLAPFINKIINNINKKEHRILITILLCFSCILSFVPGNEIYGVLSGYSAIWFIILYIIASYIRIYKVNFKKIYLISTYIGSSLLLALSQIIIVYLNHKFIKQDNIMYNMYLYNYNSILTLLSSLSLFILVINSKKTYKESSIKLINIVAPSVIAVYLIHEHLVFKNILWSTIIKQYKYINTIYLYLYLIIVVVIIFILCILIDIVINKLLSLITSNKK